MSFEALYKRSSLPTLNATDRKTVNILVVEPEAGMRQAMRAALGSLGYGSVVDTSDHANALQKFEQRDITHVIFDSKKSTFKAKEFLQKLLEIDPKIVAIPTSSEPTVDDVFDLLVLGAKGYLVKPFTESGLDDAVVMATKGEALSDSILYAKNRNEALASLVMTALDKLTVVMRQAQQFETAKAELPKRHLGLKRAVDLGLTFALGGSPKLLDSIMDFCLERARGPASRLGRVRKRLEDRKDEKKT